MNELYCKILFPILGMVQGITEFLPVSSTAHLSIIRKLADIPASRLEDILLNIGTIIAICIFFRKQIYQLIIGFYDFCLSKKTRNNNFFKIFIVSAIPSIVIGFILDIIARVNFASINYGIGLILFAVVLYFADQKATTKSIEDISLNDALIIGLIQSVALIPGVSRLGACLSAMRWLGYSREESYKFSMIISLPPVIGACTLQLITHSNEIFAKSCCNTNNCEIFFMLMGGFSSFAFGLLSLYVFSYLLKQRYTFTPVVIYRIIIGAIILLL